MTAVTENGKQNAENGICENLLFCEFYDSTRLKFQGILRSPCGSLANDGVGSGFFEFANFCIPPSVFRTVAYFFGTTSMFM